LPGNYYPGRAGEFPKATRLGLACAQAAITLQREKALKATSGKFKDVWLVFQGQHGRFFLQAVAPKTAQVSRAEKNGRRFPTTNRFSVKQSWYWYELRNYLTEFIFIINL
jgi:hypothetical protein